MVSERCSRMACRVRTLRPTITCRYSFPGRSYCREEWFKPESNPTGIDHCGEDADRPLFHGLTERLPVDSPWRNFEPQLQTEPPSMGFGEAPPMNAHASPPFWIRGLRRGANRSMAPEKGPVGPVPPDPPVAPEPGQDHPSGAEPGALICRVPSEWVPRARFPPASRWLPGRRGSVPGREVA